eukprot:7389693-Prymnesium_polylepis.2
MRWRRRCAPDSSQIGCGSTRAQQTPATRRDSCRRAVSRSLSLHPQSRTTHGNVSSVAAVPAAALLATRGSGRGTVAVWPYFGECVAGSLIRK